MKGARRWSRRDAERLLGRSSPPVDLDPVRLDRTGRRRSDARTNGRCIKRSRQTVQDELHVADAIGTWSGRDALSLAWTCGALPESDASRPAPRVTLPANCAAVRTWTVPIWPDSSRSAVPRGCPRARSREAQGVVWRLDTTDGSWAVKAPFTPPQEDEVRLSAQLQEAAYLAGVPTPQIRRTTDGFVFADVGGRRVRVYEWVDLGAPDPGLDPALVGAVVARIHASSSTTPARSTRGTTSPSARVAGTRWSSRCGTAAHRSRVGSPRCATSWSRSSPGSSHPRAVRACHRDLWADNVLPTAGGGLCVIDWDNSGPADPSRSSRACCSSSGAPTRVERAR